MAELRLENCGFRQHLGPWLSIGLALTLLCTRRENLVESAGLQLPCGPPQAAQGPIRLREQNSEVYSNTFS